ncbi:uncharacterized protein LOC128207273 isoform X2 [Mya arenaria]|uniref:uncharacterized protein LOC128207273 isoform X2 n=1 Tax=Mya arenaria TaxID=6604 RepID=UPI0022E47700|nr:uncharacterized protein LOC128207273 isoform X2 [Mya arenaria]
MTFLENGGKDLPHSTSVSLLVTFGIVNCILLCVIVFIVVIERRTGESVIKLLYTRWTRRLGRSDQHEATMTEMNTHTGNTQTHVYEDLKRTETEGNYSSTATRERDASNSENTINEGSHHVYQNSVPLETDA